MNIIFLDVDGVLAKIEYGEYNHYCYDDELWAKMILENDYYAHVKPIKIMQDFLKNKDHERIYVVTKVMNQIMPNHIFSVSNDNEKLNVMENIQQNYLDLDDKYFVMIDDTISVLNNIMDHSKFSTVHISSFLN